MRNLIRRAAVAASAAVVLLGAAAGVASASGGPVLGWSPTTSTSAYNYGTVTAGQKVSEVFTLANSGGAGTGALAITLTGSSAFTKTADTCTTASLGPKKSCTVTVTYAPTTPGQTDKATLTGTSKKPAATATLTLQGAAAKASPALATAPAAGGTVGAAVTDTATLSGGFSPGGTIEFKLYGPSTTADCSGTPLDDETVTVTGNGSYTTPAGFIPAKAGSYWWTASYSGDPSNNPVASGCDQESVTVSPVSPVIATTPSAGPLGGKGEVTDTAALSSGYNPDGTIEFKLYGPSATADCSGTPLDDETVTVTGNGSYSTPAGYTATQAGTYWWTASYSGDPGNNPATAGCGTESVTVSPASPALTTTANPANATVGTVATDTATLTGGYNPTGTIEFVPYGPFPPGAAPDCSSTILPEVGIVAVNGNGSYTSPSLIFNQPGTYYWVASYTGDTNNNLTSTGCGDEPVIISPASPALTTTPDPANATVGATVKDTASLVNGYNPTGTITFNLYPTSDCSGLPVDTETVNVSGDGTYTTPTGYAPATTGTYMWTARYSGDPNNNNVASGCGSEPVTITTCLIENTNSNQSFTALQDAVTAAAAGDTLIVKGTCTGTTQIAKNLTVTGRNSGTTPTATLDGGGQGSVLTIGTIGSSPTVTLNTLLITNGNANSNGTVGAGGGIENFGTVTLNSTTITGNTASIGSGIDNLGTVTLDSANITGNGNSLAGGGIYNGGTLTLNGSASVSNNTANGSSGGGIYNNGTVILNNSASISNNTATGGGGGGIFGGGGTVTLNDNATITGNSAAYGAGIENAGALNMAGTSAITGNSASAQGGGIFNTGGTGGTISLQGSATISNNNAIGEGGGIYNFIGTVILNDSATITGNTGSTGGGIFNHFSNTVTLNGTSTITGNTASNGNGGGIYNQCGGTLNGAVAGPGGNVYNNIPDDIFMC